MTERGSQDDGKDTVDSAHHQQTEQALHESETRYRIVADNTNDWEFWLDPEYRPLYMSPSCKSVTGRGAAEFLADPGLLSKVIHPDDRPKFLKHQQTDAKNKEHGNIEFRIVASDGTTRWIHHVCQPVFADDGTFLGTRGSNRDITERKSAEEALREARSRVATVLEGIADTFYSLDGQWRFTAVNPAAERAPFGRPAAEMLGRVIWELYPGLVGTRIHRHYLDAAEKRTLEHYEAQSPLNKRWYEVFMQGREGGVDVYMRDITERRMAEEELNKVNRTLRAMSNSDHALMHAQDEQALLDEVCQIIVRDCGHAMVWIGLAENDAGKTVRPICSAGADNGYVERLNVTWDDTERGQGPTGTAIRTGKPALCTDMFTDLRFNPWREEARKRGFVSSLVLPLLADGKAIGAVNIYARKPDAFSQAEIELLTELSEDLAYGITAIRSRVARQRAEEALRMSEENLRALSEHLPLGVSILDKDRKVIYTNPALEKILRISKTDLMAGKHLVRTYIRADGSPMPMEEMASMRAFANASTVRDVETGIVTENGTIWTSVSATPFPEVGQGVLIATVDITERKRITELIQLRLRFMDYAATHSIGEFLQKALDELSLLTQSPVGFFHFVEADQKTLSLQAWSTRTQREFCNAEGKGMHYSIDKAGVWVDCIHERKPVIHNDYASLPHRKGMPLGHARVVREALVPILRGDKIVAILGIGNKPQDYTQQDVEIVSYVADLAWEITARKRDEEALKRIEWMLVPRLGPPASVGDADTTGDQGYGDLTALNRDGLILRSIGKDLLKDITNEYLTLLGTSSAIYEINGDYAYGIFASQWCRLMDRASRDLCRTDDNTVALTSGKWLCHESCWTCCSKEAIANRAPVDIECNGGIRLYSIPILAGDEVIGAINFGYRDPSKDPAKIQQLAYEYGLDPEAILQEAKRYNTRPSFIVEIAKNRLQASARLIGALVERKMAEERIKSLARFPEENPNPVLRVGADGTIIYANEASASLLSLWNSGIGQPVPLPYRDAALEALRSATTKSIEISESGRIFGTVLAPFPESGYINIYAIDITERRKAEADLEKAYERLVKQERLAAIGAVAGGVAHDMRNPLASIKNAAYFLKMSMKDPDPEVLETLSMMEKDISESDRVIQDLLDFARPKPLVRRSVKASGIAEAALARIGVPDEIVVVRRCKDETALLVDPQQMAMALSSLVQNAVQAMPNGGTLEIGCEPDELSGTTSFWVADTGVGIPPENLPKIFDPLFTTKVKGTGLGLPLAKTLIEMHGGKIEVVSVPGKGSTFTVTIPMEKGA